MTSGFYDQILRARTDGTIVVGFNTFGYEDACEFVRAAETQKRPILLMTNRDACKAMDVALWGAMLRSIAEDAKVPVSAHLDHCSDLELIFRAIDSGYTSVMYDGSKLPLEENIANSQKVIEYAHKKGVFVECELGNVPYSDCTDAPPVFTELSDVEQFVREVDVDMLAVSVGNIHRQTSSATHINFDLLQQIEAITTVPLVVHGASGICQEDKLALKQHSVSKINVGTTLRMIFGYALRGSMAEHPKEFDRLKLMVEARQEVYEGARSIIEMMQ